MEQKETRYDIFFPLHFVVYFFQDWGLPADILVGVLRETQYFLELMSRVTDIYNVYIIDIFFPSGKVS